MPARKKETMAVRLLRNANPEWIRHYKSLKFERDGEYLVLGMHHGLTNNVFHLRVDRIRKRFRGLRRFNKVGNTLCPVEPFPVPEDVVNEARVVLGADYQFEEP